MISDQQYEFPYKNMKALASQGLLGLIVPKEFGGLGQNHVCSAMVVETIARYGCPSTAMVFSEYRVDEGKSIIRGIRSVGKKRCWKAGLTNLERFVNLFHSFKRFQRLHSP